MHEDSRKPSYKVGDLVRCVKVRRELNEEDLYEVVNIRVNFNHIWFAKVKMPADGRIVEFFANRFDLPLKAKIDYLAITKDIVGR